MRSDPSKTTRRERRAARPIPLMAASLAALAAPAAAQADDAIPLATPPSAPPSGSAPAPAPAPVPSAATGSYGDAATPSSSDSGSVPVQQAPTAPATAPQPTPQPVAPAPRRRSTKPAAKPAPAKHDAPAAAPNAAAPTDSGLTLQPSPAAPISDAQLREFQIPPFLLPVYQAAANAYQVPWQVLAAINSVETDYGRNLNVSSAGAVGWMQFMPATWQTYGVDANLDGKRDPMNPADAIFAAARYLNAAGASNDLRGAIFSYNHATWYVDEVMRRANALERIPEPVVDSLTGLAEARFPVPGDKVRYSTRERSRRWAVLHGPAGRRVLAVADGKIVSLGRDPRLGNFVVLEDAYGNRFTYAHLGSLNRLYAVPRHKALTRAQIARELHLPHRDPHPHAAATAGHAGVARHLPRPLPVIAAPPPVPETEGSGDPDTLAADLLLAHAAAVHAAQNPPVAHAALLAGARALGLRPQDIVMRPLRPGARVVAGTVLGHIGYRAGMHGAPVDFAVRPSHARRVDAAPLLRGWRALQRTRIFGPAGTSTLGGESLGRGKALLLGKEALMRRVLADPRIEIYQCGREDIASGQVDRRVLAVLEYLADEGLHPTVSALKCGHSLYTTSGNISEHSTGDAVDIAAINGTPIVGHQGPGTVTDITIRKLLLLQGTMKPHQIISLMTFPGTDNTLSMPDHYDHIHVGYHPEPGTPSPTGDGTSMPAVTQGALKPSQWDELFNGLSHQRTPRVPRRVSRFAVPAKRPKA